VSSKQYQTIHVRPCENCYVTVLFCFFLYSCFEKGCLTKAEKLMWQCQKLFWVMVAHGCLIEVLVVSAWWKETAQTRVFLLSPSLLLNHREPQSSKAKFLLPIIPISIVMYGVTPLWDNLCRNSCILLYIYVSFLLVDKKMWSIIMFLIEGQSLLTGFCQENTL